MPVLPSCRNQSANQLTGFYMRATLAFDGLKTYKAKEKCSGNPGNNILRQCNI